MTQAKNAEPPCGKHKYLSEIDAKIALMKIQKKDSSSRVSSEQRVYHCHPCRSWHLAGRRGWRKDQAIKPSAKRPRLSPDEIDERVTALLEIDQKMPIMSMLNKIKGAKKHEIKSALKRIRNTGLG